MCERQRQHRSAAGAGVWRSRGRRLCSPAAPAPPQSPLGGKASPGAPPPASRARAGPRAAAGPPAGRGAVPPPARGCACWRGARGGAGRKQARRSGRLARRSHLWRRSEGGRACAGRGSARLSGWRAAPPYLSPSRSHGCPRYFARRHLPETCIPRRPPLLPSPTSCQDIRSRTPQPHAAGVSQQLLGGTPAESLASHCSPPAARSRCSLTPYSMKKGVPPPSLHGVTLNTLRQASAGKHGSTGCKSWAARWGNRGHLAARRSTRSSQPLRVRQCGGAPKPHTGRSSWPRAPRS